MIREIPPKPACFPELRMWEGWCEAQAFLYRAFNPCIDCLEWYKEEMQIQGACSEKDIGSELLKLIGEGWNVKQLAERFAISERTARRKLRQARPYAS